MPPQTSTRRLDAVFGGVESILARRLFSPSAIPHADGCVAGEAESDGSAYPGPETAAAAMRLGLSVRSGVRGSKCRSSPQTQSGGQTAAKQQQRSWVLSEEAVMHILHNGKASEEQFEFFSVFAEHVMNPILERTEDRAHALQDCADHQLIVSTDFRRVELLISCCDLAELEQVSRLFLDKLELSTDEIDRGMSRLQRAVDLSLDCRSDGRINRPTGTGMWCRLDGMGTANPTIDAGFRFEMHKGEYRGSLEWSGVDVWLPPSEDKDTLLDFAMRESPAMYPIALIGSFLPAEPEVGLELLVPPGPSISVTGLLVFKALSFASPPDSVLQAMLVSRPWSAVMVVMFGPAGLRRVSMILSRPELNTADELALALGVDNRKRDLKGCAKNLCADETHLVEYAAEGFGYTVSVGFRK